MDNKVEDILNIPSMYESAKEICYEFFILQDMDAEEFVESKDYWYEYWDEVRLPQTLSLETIWFRSLCEVKGIDHHDLTVEEVFFFGTLH